MKNSGLTLQIEPENNPAQHPSPVIKFEQGIWRGSFNAMASDCEILIEGIDQSVAIELLYLAAVETWRIEYKFSRYRSDNVMALINRSNGKSQAIDAETNSLFDFADQCYQLSDGLFDISSGVLRKIWKFDGSDKIPSQVEINNLLPHIGWPKVTRRVVNQQVIVIVPKGMELDLGGLGKEYAVDRSLYLMQQKLVSSNTNTTYSILVNYGGDLACSGARTHDVPWSVAVESIQTPKDISAHVKLSHGALATSGDVNRFLLRGGVRYSHVLNPKTGHSVTNAPHSVTVAGQTCMQAGMLSTIASLYGEDAEAFLKAQDVEYWIQS